MDDVSSYNDNVEDNEDEFPLYEENNYPSLCVENIVHLEKENFKDKFFDGLQVMDGHLSEDEIIQNFILLDHFLAQNTNVGGD